MDTAFKKYISRIIEREGGEKVTHDPDDPGGTTKFGISQRAHKDVDIENLDYDQAVQIYHDYYYIPSKSAKLPVALQEQYLDMVVNIGYRNGAKVLQRATNAKSKSKLVVDGKIGPMTIAAVNKSKLEPGRLAAYRIRYYVKICERKPKLYKYYYGWFRRTIEI